MTTSPESPARGRITVVGTLNIDLVWRVPRIPAPGETIVADSVQREFGGKGANQAVAAARQGSRVRLVGAVGDDADGRLYREHLEREGITTENLVTAEMATGAAHVYVDPRGENSIVVDRGANVYLTPANLNAALDPVLADTDLLLLQLEGRLDTAVAAMRKAEAAGVRCVLNASPVDEVFPWGAVMIDTVIVNAHECAAWFDREPGALADLSEDTRRGFLRDRRLNQLVVTRGRDATLRIHARGVHVTPTFAVEPRDTVGAGDTFAGVLASGLASGEPWPRAIWQANVAAALSTRLVGAQSGMPTRAALMQTLVDHGERELRSGEVV